MPRSLRHIARVLIAQDWSHFSAICTWVLLDGSLKVIHQHDLVYNAIDEGKTYLIEIAQEPSGNFWRDPWRVYITFDFDSSDKLTQVRVTKWATCI